MRTGGNDWEAGISRRLEIAHTTRPRAHIECAFAAKNHLRWSGVSLGKPSLIRRDVKSRDIEAMRVHLLRPEPSLMMLMRAEDVV